MALQVFLTFFLVSDKISAQISICSSIVFLHSETYLSLRHWVRSSFDETIVLVISLSSDLKLKLKS